MRIYLAGSLHEVPWREAFRYGAPQHEYLDPSRHNDVWDEDVYTLLDLDDVAQSDLVVARAHPDSTSLYGTSLEIGYAHALHIPVLLIDALSPALDWRAQYWGMARSIAFKVVATEAEAIDILRMIAGENNGYSVFNPVSLA